MEKTDIFTNLMFKKGANEVYRIFNEQFGHKPEDDRTSFTEENIIAALMLHAYLCGVKAMMTNPSEFLELIKAMETQFGKI